MALDPLHVFIWALAFFFGSIPAGVVVARFYGVDLRKVGSGNIGATNVLRTLGWAPGIGVFLFDAFKGGIAVWIARALGAPGPVLGGVAVAAVLGHVFSPWLGFKGGKGVATGFGTLLFLDPWLALYAVPLGVVALLLTRYVSLGSLVGAAASVDLAFALARPDWEKVALALLAGLIYLTHRDNIKRLWQGTERRLGERVKPPGPPPA